MHDMQILIKKNLICSMISNTILFLSDFQLIPVLALLPALEMHAAASDFLF